MGQAGGAYFKGWTKRNDLGPPTGFRFAEGALPFGWLSRFLVPELGHKSLAQPGDTVSVVRSAVWNGYIIGVVNYDRKVIARARWSRLLVVFAPWLTLTLSFGLFAGRWIGFTLIAGSTLLVLGERATLSKQLKLDLDSEPDSDSATQPTLTAELLGTMTVSSGAIAFGDAWVSSMDGQVEAPNGRWPVVLTLATYNDDTRVAFAVVNFTHDEPEVCSRQVVGQCNIDSATAFLSDAEVRRRLHQEKGDQVYIDDGLLYDALIDRGSTWSTLTLPLPEYGGELFGFSSGLGDGRYEVALEFDAEGQPIKLTIDFGLFTDT